MLAIAPVRYQTTAHPQPRPGDAGDQQQAVPFILALHIAFVFKPDEDVTVPCLRTPRPAVDAEGGEIGAGVIVVGIAITGLQGVVIPQRVAHRDLVIEAEIGLRGGDIGCRVETVTIAVDPGLLPGGTHARAHVGGKADPRLYLVVNPVGQGDLHRYTVALGLTDHGLDIHLLEQLGGGDILRHLGHPDRQIRVATLDVDERSNEAQRLRCGVVVDLAKVIAGAGAEQDEDFGRALIREHLDLALADLGIEITPGQPQVAQIRLDGFVLAVVEGIALFQGQLVQQLAVNLVAARVPFQQNIEPRDDDRLARIHLYHHLGGSLLVATQGDLGLIVAIDLQGFLHALGDLGARGAELAFLIDRQGIEVGFNVALVIPSQTLDLIGELGRHGGRDNQQQTEAQAKCAKPATERPSGR